MCVCVLRKFSSEQLQLPYVVVGDEEIVNFTFSQSSWNSLITTSSWKEDSFVPFSNVGSSRT